VSELFSINPGVQVSPDWSKRGTIRALERELIGFKFKGAGVYCTKTDTVLVVPERDDEHFTVYVYNCQLEDTILSQRPIVRDDKR
jgi:hypothetical protein